MSLIAPPPLSDLLGAASHAALGARLRLWVPVTGEETHSAAGRGKETDMGYRFEVIDSEFEIKADRKADALRALLGAEFEYMEGCSSLEDALGAYGWECVAEGDGSVSSVWNSDGRFMHDERIFLALAPFVTCVARL